MKALILENKVIQLAAAEFEVAEPLIWVDCGDDVKDNWNYIDGVFSDPVSDADRFNALKDSKLAENKNKKESYIYTNISYLGTEFYNSERSSNNLQAAYQFGTFPLNWIDVDDNEISFTKDNVSTLISLIIARRSSGYYQEAEFNKLINAATTIEELNAIDINYV